MKYIVHEMKSGFYWEMNTYLGAIEIAQEIKETDADAKIKIEVKKRIARKQRKVK